MDASSARAPAPGRFGNQPMLYGPAEIRRSQGRLYYELVTGPEVIASLARYSWFNIYLGKGQRCWPASGERWRIRATGRARHICPLIVDTEGRRVAVTAPGSSTYGINGRNWAFSMYPTESPRWGRSNTWLLREHETELARVTGKPKTIEAWEPIPLSAGLLALVLAQFDIPGEKEIWAPRAW